MIKTLENPFYYLENFQTVLDWIRDRYSDLLIDEEREFITRFSMLPQASQALLIRMVMRKGDLFRASKLRYDEIGCTQEAAHPLVEAGWIDAGPLLALDQLFGLLKKTEIATVFAKFLLKNTARKAEQLEILRDEFPDARTFAAWYPASDDCLYQVQITHLCDRFRLLFFGNLHQGWLEFVLSDLGIFKYEKVEFSAASRGFRCREDVDAYLHLHQCRERFEQGEAPEDVLASIPQSIFDNPWLESRRAKLLYRIAQHHEQMGELAQALKIYSICSCTGSRIRTIRVLERTAQFASAYALAQAAEQAPESDAERQQLSRILPRLQRKLGQPKTHNRAMVPVVRVDLILPEPETEFFVEGVVRDHLAQLDAPVHYVENTLINSIFGLLCWDAIFTAIPGAFFHPFHIGPADLHDADFYHRRTGEFNACLAQLDTDQYKHTITKNFAAKAGIQSPFVTWDALTEELMDHALACLPREHLRKLFDRILLDIKSNRTGFPDLIQFWPREQRYEMIEVKGPGDRLQDNQIRWMEYCAAHDMPVKVCYVQWMESTP